MQVPSLSKVSHVLNWRSKIILSIFVLSPFAFGAVHSFSYQLIQFLVFLLFLLDRVLPSPLWEEEKSEGYPPRSFLSRYPFTIPFLLWLGLVAIELIPLPLEFLRILSKETYELYVSILGASSSEWKTLSLSPFDSWRAFIQVITVAMLFYLTIFTPHHPSRSFLKGPTQDLFFNQFLFLVFLIVAFEASYGLLEYFSGGKRIYFFERLLGAASGAAGTFVNRNHFANYLLLFFPFLCSWFAFSLRPALPSEKSVGSLSGTIKIILAMLLILLTMAIVASHSRMAMATGLLAVFLLALNFLFFRGMRKMSLFLIGCLFIAILFFIFLDPGFALFKNRMSLFLQGYSWQRFQIWQDSLNIIQNFPWFGTGLETFQFIFPKYTTVPVTLRYLHAHSDWVELLVETGICGFLLIGLSMLMFFWTFVKRLRFLNASLKPLAVGILISLGTFLVHSMAEFNFHIPGNAYSFAILAGMGVRLLEMEGKR